MTAASLPESVPTDPVRTHCEMLHGLADGIEGVFVVSAYNANLPKGGGTVTHHRVGDIDGMVAAITAHSETPGANVYTGLHLMRRDIPRGKRGTAADIVAVLGLVADMDADTGNAGTLPCEPSYIIETSPGNRQPVWLFDKPLTVAEAAPLAAALKHATGSDHGTADVDHVWRIPGTKNWPNAAKLKRGRSPEPAAVCYLQEWGGDLTGVETFRSALAPWAIALANDSKPVQLGDLPDVEGVPVSEKLAALLAADDVDNRSDHAAAVAERLAFDGYDAETAAALFLSAKGNWLNRYQNEESARRDFTRLWGKPFCTKHTEMRSAGAKLAASLKPANDNFASDTAPIDLWAHRKYPPLPTGLLPPIIEEFARTQGDLMGVDPGGLAMAALAVCAAAIPDNVKLQVKRHEKSWLESARIWVAVVGNPSTKKTPLINAAARPLKKADGELFRVYQEEMQRYEQLKKVDKSARMPKNTRLRMEDITIEAAQEVLRDSPDGVLCLQDELSGWFGSLDKYSSGRGASKDRAFWLQSFNGGSYVLNRVGRGAIMINNLSVSLLGGIQPEAIRSIARDMHDDGLLQRFFPIMLSRGGVGRDVETPPVAETYHRLVSRLNKMRKPKSGLGGNVGIMIDTPLRFDDEAQDFRQEVTEEFRKLQEGWEAVNLKLSAHIGKFEGLFARLCVLWQCAESADTVPDATINIETARRVAEFMRRYLLQHSIAFYTDVLGISDRQDAVVATAGFILSHGLSRITVRDVRRGDRIMRTMDNLEAQAVLEQLDAFGWLEPIPTTRQDSQAWTVRPAVHTMFAERAKAEAERRTMVRKVIASGSN